MAPKTLATPEQALKLADIAREYWAGEKGIKCLPPDRSEKRPNLHPKTNADIGSKPAEEIEVFIADSWPLESFEDQQIKERIRRQEGGQGISLTRRHWKRQTRRVIGRRQHQSRRRNWTRTRTTRAGGRKVVRA